MAKKNANQNVRMATTDQLKQIWAIVMQALPTRLTWAQAQHWIGCGTELAVKIRAIFAIVDPFRELLVPWVKFYHDEFNIDLNPSTVHVVPDKKDGFDWLIVVAPGVTIEMVLAVCAKRFKVCRWTNDNLDELTREKTMRFATDAPYGIWVRPRVEADEEHKDQSYDSLQGKILGITLLERLLLELKHFIETGGHLDISNVTLCSGSLSRDGSVASVYWRAGHGELYVLWCNPDSAYGHLRVREVIPVQ